MYYMSNDWSWQYEKLLEKEMAKTPGGFPGAHVEEVEEVV